MSISISCRELGLDCFFVCEGDTEQAVVESLINHIQLDHDEEWFVIEEIYQAACSAIRGKAA